MLFQELLKTGSLAEQARSYKRDLMSIIAKPAAVAESVKRSTSLLSVLPKHHNIQGIGIGTKRAEAVRVVSECAIRVYVHKKLPKSDLTKKQLVPSFVNGMPTDVIAIGDIRANARPVQCGVSIGHPSVGAGTLGCLLKVTGKSGTFILSNNHVLANLNAAAIGDPILEPGSIDGGSPVNPIATLSDFVPLNFNGGTNTMDAAIAQVTHDGDVVPQIAGIGSVASSQADVAINQSVKKTGRSTGTTFGTVGALHVEVKIGYENGQTANFVDQIAIDGVGGLFTSAGDSGALVVDAVSTAAIALHVAAGTLPSDGLFHSFANHIAPILTRFKARIL